MKGYLILETGDWFEGTWIGAEKDSDGEVVFQTGMTGYQEVITDPSYAGQIVTFTYPLIGNYGINALDDQSIRPYVKGVIVTELCKQPSHSQYKETFEEVLKKYNIPGLAGVDTRELTKIIRKHGTLSGVISKTLDLGKIAELKALKKKNNNGYGELLVGNVSTKEPHFYPGDGPHIVVIDYGSKFSIVRALRKLGCAVTIVPFNHPMKEIEKLKPDGILLSNGPGDPKDLKPWITDVRKLIVNYPTLGICLGHQVIGLALGADTEKLPFGHRGVNHPVINLETNQVWITSQNHGYMVKEDSLAVTDLMITHRNINDDSVEGMKHRYLPIQSVQFHPEAHPGPIEAFEIFTSFVNQCNSQYHVLWDKGEKQYA